MPLNLFGRPLHTGPVDPALLEEANRRLFAQARLDSAPAGSVGAPSGVQPAARAVDRRINPFQAAALASSPIPGLGDVMGLAADAQMYATDPASRTWGNYGLSTLGLLPFVPNALGMVGGRMAKTADLEALAKAEKLDASGVDRADVFNQTGWWKGRDGKWRFEIDDSQAAVIPDAVDIGPAREQLAHPALYAAYPETRSTSVLVRPEMGDAGSYGRRNVSDYYGSPTIEVGKRDKSILLHELQHNAQDIEGFARGGNPDEFAKSSLQQLANLRLHMDHVLSPASEFAEWYKPEMGRDWQAIIDQYSDAKGVSGKDAYDAFIAAFDDASGTVMTPAEIKRHILENERLAYELVSDLDGTERYRRLAGEAEARAVQARRNMTAADRKARPFWMDFDVPESEQVVKGR